MAQGQSQKQSITYGLKNVAKLTGKHYLLNEVSVYAMGISGVFRTLSNPCLTSMLDVCLSFEFTHGYSSCF